MRITSNENVVQASSPVRGYRFKETFWRTSLSYQIPRGNSLFFYMVNSLAKEGISPGNNMEHNLLIEQA
jgi:hypothetical protein